MQVFFQCINNSSNESLFFPFYIRNLNCSAVWSIFLKWKNKEYILIKVTLSQNWILKYDKELILCLQVLHVPKTTFKILVICQKGICRIVKKQFPWWVFHFILFNLLYEATTWTLSPSFILWVYCYSSISPSVLSTVNSYLEKQTIIKRCKSSSK